MNIEVFLSFVPKFFMLLTALIFLGFAISSLLKVAEPKVDEMHDIPRQLLLGIFCVFMFCVFLYATFFVFDGSLTASPEGFGQFGDYLGGVLNPIVSFAALYGLWKTLDAQKKSSDESNNYLKAQIQKDADKHNDLMFLELMGQYRSVLNDIEIPDNLNDLQGKSKLTLLKNIIWKNHLPYFKGDFFNKIHEEPLDSYTYWVLIKTDMVLLNPYFRVVYNILNFQSKITSDIDENLKYKNFKYFRAQLTEAELQLIALDAFFSEGNDAYQKETLLKFFALFKYMQDRNLKHIVTKKIGENCFFNENEENDEIS